MAIKQIPLELISKGWYMSWSISTQAANNICVTLQDSMTSYVNNVCRQSQTFGILSEGFQQVNGTDMSLTVDIDSSDNIFVVNHPIVVPNLNGIAVAQGYAFAFEDEDDQDFNDLYVSIMAWRKSG